MEGLGELGFWLAVGAVVVALVMRGWLRERDKQAMLRDMMKVETEGKITEVLAYLREKDAAEQRLTRQMWGLGTGESKQGNQTAAGIAAIIVGVVAFIGGLISLAMLSERSDSGFAPIGAMAAFWMAGGAIAWLIVAYFPRKESRKDNNGPPSDA